MAAPCKPGPTIYENPLAREANVEDMIAEERKAACIERASRARLARLCLGAQIAALLSLLSTGGAGAKGTPVGGFESGELSGWGAELPAPGAGRVVEAPERGGQYTVRQGKVKQEKSVADGGVIDVDEVRRSDKKSSDEEVAPRPAQPQRKGERAGAPARAPARLRVSDNGRYLVSAAGQPVFLLADTAWGLARRLRREDAAMYLRTRRQQGFNAVTFIAVGSNGDISEGPSDAYGRPALAVTGGRPDPAKPLVTPGNDPNAPGEYDFWDHLDYCVDQAAAEGLYVLLLPTWGSWVVGSHNGGDTSEVIFDEKSAYAYGRFLGDRYKDRTHVIWMLGGDRAAVNGEKDSRPVFRAMAKGVADGGGGRSDAAGKTDHSAALMSYHPRKGAPQSSAWFHDDPWLAFNSIQEWPENQVGWMITDWNRSPAKPTWVFEGRYENYHKNGYKPQQWGAWQMRQQAYQTVFAGAFGHTYGNERIFGFGKQSKPGPKDSPPAPGTWQEHLQDAGGLQMRHLARLMGALRSGQYLDRIPDQSLIDGDAGEAGRLSSDRLTATRGSSGDYAMVYSANGRGIRLRMDRLAGPAMDAFWYNPRNGTWHAGDHQHENPTPFLRDLPGGAGSPVREFDPPGQAEDGNDWVLVLRRQQV